MESKKATSISFCEDCGRLRLRDVADKLQRLFNQKSIKPTACGICKKRVKFQALKSLKKSSGVSHNRKRRRKCKIANDEDHDVDKKENYGPVADIPGDGDSESECDVKPFQNETIQHKTRLRTGAIKSTHYRKSCSESDGTISDIDFDDGRDSNSDDSSHTEQQDDKSTEIKIKTEDLDRFKCEYCNYACRTQRDLRKHSKTHSNNCGHFVCEKCQHVFKNKKIYERHVTRNKCGVPKKQQRVKQTALADSTSSVPTNVAIDHSDITKYLDARIVGWLADNPSSVDTPFKCKQCESKEFRKLHRFLKHMRRDHPDLNVPVIKRPIVCDQCGMAFINRGGLNKHLVRHVDDRPFVCQHVGCGKTFKSKKYLNGHEDHIHSVKQNMCSVCGLRFVNSYRLRLHETRVHQGVRSYKCQHCGKAFATCEYRNRHERLIHLKERPWVCEVCGRSYQDKKQMIVHGRSHTGEKPYACDQCDYRCVRPDYLAKHVRIHIGKKPQICTHCGMKFALRATLEAHEKKHHADVIAIPFHKQPQQDKAPSTAPLITPTSTSVSRSTDFNNSSIHSLPDTQVPVVALSNTPTTSSCTDFHTSSIHSLPSTQVPVTTPINISRSTGFHASSIHSLPIHCQVPVVAPSNTPTIPCTSFHTSSNFPYVKDPVRPIITTCVGFQTGSNLPLTGVQLPIPPNSTSTSTSLPSSIASIRTSFQPTANLPLPKNLSNEAHNPSYRIDDMLIYEAL